MLKFINKKHFIYHGLGTIYLEILKKLDTPRSKNKKRRKKKVEAEVEKEAEVL